MSDEPHGKGEPGHSEPIFLREGSTGELVPARLLVGLTHAEIAAANAEWRRFQQEVVAALLAQGHPRHMLREHFHWDWEWKEKVAEAEARFLGIECSGQIQGLMILIPDRPSRLALHHGSKLVYVDYLASAPWNLRGVVSERRYVSIGRSLIIAAIRFSEQCGDERRVGLHSLPQAEKFYAVGCGMTDLGPDPDYYGLRYYEMTAEQAERLTDTE